MKRKFILNPISGRGVAAKNLDQIRAFFLERTGQFDLSVAQSRKDVSAMARQAARDGFDQIVPLGGDGTLNATINGLFESGQAINPETSVAVAKLGTGCDFFKTVVIGNKIAADWKEIALEHETRSIDVGRIVFGPRKDRDCVFINMASVGMSAKIAKEKDAVPHWIPASLSYALPTVAELFLYKPTPALLEIDGKKETFNLSSAFICKGIYAGGGMRFGGGVTLADGLFDVTVIKDVSSLKMLFEMSRLYTGTLSDSKDIEKHLAKHIRVESVTPLLIEFEGEIDESTDFDITLIPQSLRVCFPQM